MKIKHYISVAAVYFSVLAMAHAQASFTQITNSPVVNDIGSFIGAAWGDFHGSGFQDLIVCNYNGQTNVYYRNNGDGTFTKISDGEPVQDIGYHVYPGIGDYDNDGYPDLFITAGAYSPTGTTTTNRLYHNNRDGTFSLVTVSGATGPIGHVGPGAWADYNNDGYLDVFFASHGLFNDNGWTNQLFRNNGDGTFTAVTSGAIVHDNALGFCVAWEDYDNDGFVDLLVLNNHVANGISFLYHNNGNGTFTRVTTNIIGTDVWSQGAACAAWGDYDNDGLPDLYITDNAGARCQLYHNSGNGVFTRVNSGSMLFPSPGGSFNGCSWGDYDNDGYLDLVVSGYNEPNAIFHNNGDGTFTKIVSVPPVFGGGAIIGCGAVSLVDYDNDGFLDVFIGVVTTNSSISAPGSSLLFHNNGNSNAWLEVKLIGTVANRSAIGAKLRVNATIGSRTFWQLREINGGGGYNDPPLVAHFGLGDSTNVDTLRIEWPSGTVQELHNVAARQILTVTEPPRLYANLTNGAPQVSIKGWPGMQFDIQSSPDLTNWSAIGTVTVTNLNGLAEITDTNAPAVDQRFYRAVSH